MIEIMKNKVPEEYTYCSDCDIFWSVETEESCPLCRYKKWVSDLQSGKYINCVYCGHQYPIGTPGVLQEVLYEHIRKCPKHPLRKAENRITELEEALKTENLRNGM